jgi:hypothetical protein
MATLTTLTALPSVINAGETLLFAVQVAGYPPGDGWTLSYFLKNKDAAVVELTSTQSGNDHLFNVAADVTGGWTAGEYFGVARVDDGTNFRVVSDVRLEVRQDLSQVGADYDPRSHARKCLDAIESVMEGRASKDIINTTIAGQSVGRMTPEQLAFWRNYYRAEVSAEEAALDAANGKATGKNILLRFN